MSSVLAIESSAAGAKALRQLIRDGVREPLTVVGSIDAALTSIAQRVPEVILISPLMPPQEEAALVARLRDLPKARCVQTLIAPHVLRQAAAPAPSRWWGRQDDTSGDASDDVRKEFASELAIYLKIVRDRRVEVALVDELSPEDRRAAVRLTTVRDARLALDGTAVDVVDLSVTGAQVLAPLLLVPGQTVQVMFRDQRRAMQCTAAIVWGAVEDANEARGITYRAGLDFRDGDRDFLAQLCAGRSLAPASLDVPESFGRVLFGDFEERSRG